MASCSVIIPVFNQAALTAQCLQAVFGSWPEEIVVVDDASSDQTPELLARLGSRVKVVSHQVNRGFAQSCNDGAAVAAGEYLLFLNNDTLPQPGALLELVRYADVHPEAAVIGSKLIYPDHTIQHAGVVICQDRYPRHIYSGFPAHHPAVCQSRRFQIVTAACALVRRAVFEEVHGFDTAYRNGFEDVDFCLRLGMRGCAVHYCAESVVCHLESVSPGRFLHDRDNVARYRERWLHRVRPDDLRYYLQDGLLQLDYEGRFPIHLNVSPALATIDNAARAAETEQQLRRLSRQVAELSRENTRLRLELGAHAPDARELRYQELRRRICETVQSVVPAGATVLVISKGDGALLEFPGRQGRHFPQNERGAYAGFHPADGAEALRQLQQLQAAGAEYLVIPAFAQWWLDHYAEFRLHLETHCAQLQACPESCSIYALSPPHPLPVSACQTQNAN